MSAPEPEPAAEQPAVTGEISNLTDLERLTENPASYNVVDYRFTPLSQQQFSQESMLYPHQKLPDGTHAMVVAEGSQLFGLPGGQVHVVATGDTRQPVAVYQLQTTDYISNVPPPASPNPPVRGIHHSLNKLEHRNSRATRRGPMDEMRQLFRILAKLMPQSVQFMCSNDEGGGGNRVSEDQIKAYLKQALGEAPQPEWGLPQGWGAYLAELFAWATDRPVTRDQAMQCARRLPGRSWEAVEEALQEIGVAPSTWPLPLTKAGVLNAKGRDATMALPPPPPAVKNDVDPESAEHKSKRRKLKPGLLQSASSDAPVMTELQCWQQALHCLEQAILYKDNTTPPEGQDELQRYKSAVRRLLSTPDTGALRSEVVQHASISTGTPVPGNIPNMGGISVQPVYWRGADQRGPITGLSPLPLPAAPEVLTQMQQMPGTDPGTTISYMPIANPQPTSTAMMPPTHVTSNSVVMHGSLHGAPSIALPQTFVKHAFPGYVPTPVQVQPPPNPVQPPVPAEHDVQQYQQPEGHTVAVEAVPVPAAPPATSPPPPATDIIPVTASPHTIPPAPRPAPQRKDPLDAVRNQVYGSIDQKASAPPNRLVPNPVGKDTHAVPLFQTPGTYTAVAAARPKDTPWGQATLPGTTMQPPPTAAAAAAAAWVAAIGASGYGAVPGSYGMPVVALPQQMAVPGLPAPVEEAPAAPTPMDTTPVPQIGPAPVEGQVSAEAMQAVQAGQAVQQQAVQQAYYDANGQPASVEQQQYNAAVQQQYHAAAEQQQYGGAVEQQQYHAAAEQQQQYNAAVEQQQQQQYHAAAEQQQQQYHPGAEQQQQYNAAVEQPQQYHAAAHQQQYDAAAEQQQQQYSAAAEQQQQHYNTAAEQQQQQYNAAAEQQEQQQYDAAAAAEQQQQQQYNPAAEQPQQQYDAAAEQQQYHAAAEQKQYSGPVEQQQYNGAAEQQQYSGAVATVDQIAIQT